MPRRLDNSMSEYNASSADKKAASVLPEPVGEWISTLSPFLIKGHASSCGSVGVACRSPNHFATGALNKPKTPVFVGISRTMIYTIGTSLCATLAGSICPTCMPAFAISNQLPPAAHIRRPTIKHSVV